MRIATHFLLQTIAKPTVDGEITFQRIDTACYFGLAAQGHQSVEEVVNIADHAQLKIIDDRTERLVEQRLRTRVVPKAMRVGVIFQRDDHFTDVLRLQSGDAVSGGNRLVATHHEGIFLQTNAVDHQLIFVFKIVVNHAERHSRSRRDFALIDARKTDFGQCRQRMQRDVVLLFGSFAGSTLTGRSRCGCRVIKFD